MKAFGYPAELLPKVCGGFFLKAQDADELAHNQHHIAVKAEALICGLANTGIVATLGTKYYACAGLAADRDTCPISPRGRVQPANVPFGACAADTCA